MITINWDIFGTLSLFLTNINQHEQKPSCKNIFRGSVTYIHTTVQEIYFSLKEVCDMASKIVLLSFLVNKT